MSLHCELEADAQHVLDDAHVPWARVIAVNPDAILYENALHKARTLWLHRHKGTGRLRVRMVDGFPPWPPHGWPGDMPG